MVWFIIGIAIGMAVAIIFRGRTYGTLKVYVSNDKEEEPYLYVELNNSNSIDAILKKRRVRFQVGVRHI